MSLPKKILCVGGCLDGEMYEPLYPARIGDLVEIPIAPKLEFRKITRRTLIDDDPFRPMKFKREWYSVRLLASGSRRWYVLAPVKMKDGEMIDRLLKGYRNP